MSEAETTEAAYHSGFREGDLWARMMRDECFSVKLNRETDDLAKIARIAEWQRFDLEIREEEGDGLVGHFRPRADRLQDARGVTGKGVVERRLEVAQARILDLEAKLRRLGQSKS